MLRKIGIIRCKDLGGLKLCFVKARQELQCYVIIANENIYHFIQGKLTMKTPAFKLSLLTLALCAAHVQAADDTQTLPTIHVKGERTTSTHRVSIKKLDESTSSDMKDVLFNEPSVSFGGGNATSQWTTIRGMGQDQIDVKVDNAYSDTQMFHHNGRFLLDPALVKVVAVQKGAGSASAGIGATSGAVVAKTVDAADLLRDGQDVGFKLNVGYNSNKGYSRGGSVYGKWNGLDALFAANWLREDDYKPGKGYHSATGNKVNNSGLGQRGLLAKIGYNFNENNRVVLSHRQEKTYGLRNLREEFDFAQINNTANNNPHYRILTQDTTNVDYEGKQLGVLGNLKANVYVQNMKRAEPTANSNPTNKLTTTGANIGFDTPLFEQHTLKYGVNWRHQESKPASRIGRGSTKPANTVNEEKTDTGIYAEGIWDFAPVTLTTGLRYDHFEANFSDGKKFSGSKVNPSIGVIYDVNPDLSFNASLNYASRSPRLTEVFLSGGTVRTAAPNLKAERARNTEIGFKYRWNNALDLEGSYFWQQIRDVQAVKNNVYYSGGTLKNNGYELAAGYRLGNLTARAGVAYNKPKMNGASLDSIVTAVPMGRTWTAGLAYQFANPNLEIGWRGRFVQSSRYDVNSTSTRGGVTTTQMVSTKRSGYGVNDIYLNWKPTGKDDWNVNFAVNNIGNKYYKSHSQRESGAGSSLPETGRDVRVAVNYRF